MSDPLRRLGHHTADTAGFAVESIRRRNKWAGPDSPIVARHLEVEQNRPPHLVRHDHVRLAVRVAYDPNWYPKGVRITDSEFAAASSVDPIRLAR